MAPSRLIFARQKRPAGRLCPAPAPLRSTGTFRWRWILFTLCFFPLGLTCRTDPAPGILLRAQAAFDSSRSNYLAAPQEKDSAWRFSKACFELAEYATNDTLRAALAEEGIKSARFASETAPTNAPAHFYLALNLGELARTKSLGALSLIRQMETELLRAIELDAHFDHAGPDRSLGMLYLDAPGWPVSIGSKPKARLHLEKAVSLEPDYPDNHLSLLEAYVRWGDRAVLNEAIARYRQVQSGAKKKYSGPEWDQPWKDWEERWKAVLAHAARL